MTLKRMESNKQGAVCESASVEHSNLYVRWGTRSRLDLHTAV